MLRVKSITDTVHSMVANCEVSRDKEKKETFLEKVWKVIPT